MNDHARPSNLNLQSWRPSGNRPRSAYLHIPFCRHRCGYCNFSVVSDRDYLVERYLDAMEREINWLDDRYQLDTLFLGGGTPSHLSPANLKRLNGIVKARFELVADAEVTAECNPNDLTDEKAASLAEFGVNRISLGVQSLNFEKLKILERDHDPDDVGRAVQMARQFASSISVDLIFAAPGESPAHWRRDILETLLLSPDHLSTYELTYEKGTQFWNRKLHGEFAIADEDLRADMYLESIELLEQAGFAQYETSSFAKPGHHSRHNEVYWMGLPYFAFGPGASRYIDGRRETNHQSTFRYLKMIESGNPAIAFSEQLTPEDSARELLAIGLRRVAGIELADFQQRNAYSALDLIGDRLALWTRNELVHWERNTIRLTHRGRMLGDQIAAEIVRHV